MTGAASERSIGSAPEDESTPIDSTTAHRKLIGMELEGKFMLESIIRQDNHYVVFSIKLLNPGSPVSIEDGENSAFEARVYDLRGLSPTLRRYRIRSIKRMLNRQVLSTIRHGQEIIVYRAGDIHIHDDKQATTGGVKSKNDTKHQGIELLYPAIHPTKSKTSYQQESDRLRQRDKRRAKRLKSKVLHAWEDSGLLFQEDNDFDEATFSMCLLLHIAFSPRQQLLGHFSPKMQQTIEQYLQKRNELPALQDLDEIQDFMTIKEHELVYLRRIGKQLPDVIQRCHGQLGQLLRSLQVRIKPKEQKDFENARLEAMKLRFKSLKTVSENLPDLITNTETVLASVKEKLKLAHDGKKKKDVQNLQSWMYHVVPGSESYARLSSRLQDAEKLYG